VRQVFFRKSEYSYNTIKPELRFLVVTQETKRIYYTGRVIAYIPEIAFIIGVFCFSNINKRWIGQVKQYSPLLKYTLLAKLGHARTKKSYSVRFEVSTAVTMMIIISQKMIIIKSYSVQFEAVTAVFVKSSISRNITPDYFFYMRRNSLKQNTFNALWLYLEDLSLYSYDISISILFIRWADDAFPQSLGILSIIHIWRMIWCIWEPG
jgi:hypothetical protein